MSRLRAHKSRSSGLTACKQSEAATAPYSAAPFLTRVPHPRRRPLDAHEFGPAQYMNSTSKNHPTILLLTRPPQRWSFNWFGSENRARVYTSMYLRQTGPTDSSPPPRRRYIIPPKSYTSSTHKSVHTIYSHCRGFVYSRRVYFVVVVVVVGDGGGRRLHFSPSRVM